MFDVNEELPDQYVISVRTSYFTMHFSICLWFSMTATSYLIIDFSIDLWFSMTAVVQYDCHFLFYHAF